MASGGPAASPAAKAASMAARSVVGQRARPASTSPRPSLGLMPAASSAAPCSANSVGKNARTAWPKMIGSETFIIVALRWTEKSTPSALAPAICVGEERVERRRRA